MVQLRAMQSDSTARRLSAILALVAIVAVFVILVVMLVRDLLLLVAAVSVAAAIAAATYALTRTGARRIVATVVALFALLAAIVLLIGDGRVTGLLLVIAALAVAGGATRYALARDISALKSGLPLAPRLDRRQVFS